MDIRPRRLSKLELIEANCHGIGADLFHSEADSELALRYCRGCAIRVPCLLDALYFADRGVRGGTTEEQRRKDPKNALRIAARG